MLTGPPGVGKTCWHNVRVSFRSVETAQSWMVNAFIGWQALRWMPAADHPAAVRGSRIQFQCRGHWSEAVREWPARVLSAGRIAGGALPRRRAEIGVRVWRSANTVGGRERFGLARRDGGGGAIRAAFNLLAANPLCPGARPGPARTASARQRSQTPRYLGGVRAALWTESIAMEMNPVRTSGVRDYRQPRVDGPVRQRLGWAVMRVASCAHPYRMRHNCRGQRTTWRRRFSRPIAAS